MWHEFQLSQVVARPAPLTRTGKVLLAMDLIVLAIILGIVLYERNEFGDMATLGILIFLASLPSFLIGLTLFRFRLFNKPSRFIAHQNTSQILQSCLPKEGVIGSIDISRMIYMVWLTGIYFLAGYFSCVSLEVRDWLKRLTLLPLG